MINNNKILTVSYGTFSCTLEGFDDSFTTMKAIAEYFRDLAAEDRYFGAEPPQPDAEMLARIAQRDASRHVQAREHEGRIVLSALASDTPGTFADETPAPIPDATPSDIVAPSTVQAIETIAAETILAPAPVAETVAQSVAQSVMAHEEPEHVADIEHPVAEVQHALADPVADVDDPAAYAIDADVPVAPQILTNVPDAAEAFFAGTPSTADTYDNDVIAEVAEPAPTPETPVEVASTAHVDDDSIASKLERIRMVVAKRDVAFDNGEDESVEQPTKAILTLDDMPSDLVVHVDEVADADAVQDPTIQNIAAATENTVADEIEHGDAEIGAVEASDIEVEDDNFEDDQPEYDEEDTFDVISQAAEEIEEALAIDDDTAASQATGDDDNLAAILAGLDKGLASDDDDDTDTPDEALFEEASDEDDGPLILTNVQPRDQAVAEATETPEALHDETVLENFDFNDAQPSSSPITDEAPASLSDEDENALQRELAELESELDEDDGVDTQDAADLDDFLDGEIEATEEDETPAAPQRDTLPALDDTQAEDVLRLMEEAEHQMDEPESSDRRSAFAHLRAAVAAKIADRAVGNREAKEELQTAYRSDLAAVVKPRGADADGHTTPLKLVAEQRVDLNDIDTLGQGIRAPRQTASIAEDGAEIPSSFTEFASEMGATKLPDLLEAAAAYMSFVEGHSQFSRPQLMTKVRQVEKDEFSREDGLRSFGELLRSGKIEKIRGGRFTVSDQIGFKPDERAAG